MALNTAERLVAQAAKWVGYLEKRSNSNLNEFVANAGSNNFTCFNRDYGKYMGQGETYWQAQPWCAMFVSCMFVYEFGLEKGKSLLGGNLFALCSAGRDRFKNIGRFYTSNPQPGDVIYFYNSARTGLAHVGLVERVSNTNVFTIEGNTSSESGVVPNGGAVARKSYSLGYGRIAGYGRPQYDISVAPYIKQHQAWLNTFVVDLIGKQLDVDGEFGPLTKRASVMAYQKLAKRWRPSLEIDGVYGPETRAASAMKNKDRSSLGDRGDIVTLLQGMLYCYDCNPQGIDGIYGANTATAVKDFQTAKGLVPSGDADRFVWNKLLAK